MERVLGPGRGDRIITVFMYDRARALAPNDTMPKISKGRSDMALLVHAIGTK